MHLIFLLCLLLSFSFSVNPLSIDIPAGRKAEDDLQSIDVTDGALSPMSQERDLNPTPSTSTTEERNSDISTDHEPLSLESHQSLFTAFMNSLVMVIATELGDKTFFIAAIMSMKHSRVVVFSGALAALALMTALSAIIGVALPAFLPVTYTKIASALLFLYFGGKLLYDGVNMDANADMEDNEELKEVEMELSQLESDLDSDGITDSDSVSSMSDLESGKETKGVGVLGLGGRKRRATRGAKHRSAASKHEKFSLQQSIMRQFKCASPLFVQAFTMTFLAEWGDRSQIATIALATTQNGLGVTLGGILGHACCTGLACIGGRLLATKISEKQVAIGGGILFLIFGVLTFMGFS